MRRSDFDRVEDSWKKDRSLFGPLLKVFGGVMLLLFGFFLISTLFGTGAQVVNTIQQEAGAQFERYQKFKDLAAAIDAQGANIEMYQARLAALEEIPRLERLREERDEISQVRAELIGVRAKYNKMAGQYNAAMAKINYRYANVGQMPAGADPLPREYRLYER